MSSVPGGGYTTCNDNIILMVIDSFGGGGYFQEFFFFHIARIKRRFSDFSRNDALRQGNIWGKKQVFKKYIRKKGF